MTRLFLAMVGQTVERVQRIIRLTVSWQSWKAATRNPVEALRYE
ncbi:MAG: hypothetical protein PHI28_18730 [Mangrovibacterium sp.]|nr:hypothetical protein [Mangrovibacterium sp.]